VPIVEVQSTDDARVSWYRGVSDPALLHGGGRFVAEGRAVVRRLLESRRWEIESLLLSPAALRALEPCLKERPELTVFVTPVDGLVALAGYNIHRGALAIARRSAAATVESLIGRAPASTWLLGLEGLAGADNVGACFRNAAAFGLDGVMLDRACADPLYRKAIRTSMAATLCLPFARVPAWPDEVPALRAAGFDVIGLTPAADAEDIASIAGARGGGRVLLLVGNEGTGLAPATLAACTRLARIPLAPGVDSLNVATAAAIALYAFGRRPGCPEELD
jgi:tRNA G18 (ribose-2'-O)-methylase SpoU